MFRANFIRQNALRFEVTQPIYAGGKLQSGVAASESQAASETQQRLAQTRFDAGTAARLDVLRAGVEVANANAVLIRARSAADTALQPLRATAQEQQAVHAINATLDSARLELTTAVQELASARELVEVQRQAVELARESLSIAEVSNENGAITSSELNDARVSLMQTDWALAQAKYAVIVAGARTRFAAGL